MLCNQCQQTAGGTACTKMGVCGKDPDIQSLQDNLLFSLKGISAYAYHAREFGYTNPKVDAFFAEGLYSTLTNVNFDLERALELNMEAGQITLEAMKMLRKAHVDNFGEMQPVQVSTGTAKGHGIVVTGHNLKALYELLRQTEGKGINIYTHSEMLPSHGYPKIRAFSHLKGNLGKAWYDQKKLFSEFPGAVLGTSNCVLVPQDEYKDRMFTTGIAALPGVKHIHGYDYSPVIEKALSLPETPEKTGEVVLTTGYTDSNILPLAGQLIEAVNAGKIKHFFLVGGCERLGKTGSITEHYY